MNLIKKETSYRPFNDYELLDMLGKRGYYKGQKCSFYEIRKIYGEPAIIHCTFADRTLGERWFFPEQLLNDFIFEDGKPYGVKI